MFSEKPIVAFTNNYISNYISICSIILCFINTLACVKAEIAHAQEVTLLINFHSGIVMFTYSIYEY